MGRGARADHKWVADAERMRDNGEAVERRRGGESVEAREGHEFLKRERQTLINRRYWAEEREVGARKREIYIFLVRRADD